MSVSTLSRHSALALILIAALPACAGQSASGALVPTPNSIMRATGAAAAAPVQPDGEAAPAKYKLLYSFKANPDGEYPSGRLTELNGAIYGATIYGGTNDGILFKMSTSGAEHVIQKFSGANGNQPVGGPIASAGALFGTTYYGGASNLGTIFRASTSGSVTLLHSFTGVGSSKTATDGAGPLARLVSYNGTFYGTTYSGGWCSGSSSGCGTVFSVNSNGTYRVLYSFQGTSGAADGQEPSAGLVELNGKLYGTTSYGGTCGTSTGCGTVFEITTAGKENVLYRFKSKSDGNTPYAGLVALNGKLYGVTEAGGAYGFGTIYEITTTGTERVLYSFKGSYDGTYPQGDLVNVNGTLYGTTRQGGTNGLGTVFSASPAGKLTTLHSFGATGDGTYPLAGLTNANGTLYGTTEKGGADGYGTAFAITP